MICASCGGRVTWCGPITALTHTECNQCGAINNQLPDDAPDEGLDGDAAILAENGL